MSDIDPVGIEAIKEAFAEKIVAELQERGAASGLLREILGEIAVTVNNWEISEVSAHALAMFARGGYDPEIIEEYVAHGNEAVVVEEHKKEVFLALAEGKFRAGDVGGGAESFLDASNAGRLGFDETDLTALNSVMIAWTTADIRVRTA